MAYNERDFQTALVCGLMAKGRKLKGERTPIAYLYGETYEGEFRPLFVPYHAVLPSAEDWDRTVYPYAMMYYATFSSYVLCVSKEPFYGTGEPYMYNDKQFGETVTNTSQRIYFEEVSTGDIAPNGYRKKIWTLTEDEYIIYDALGQNKDTDGDGQYDFGAEGLINWANHDIISADGKTVLVAASEPVPIYE